MLGRRCERKTPLALSSRAATSCRRIGWSGLRPRAPPPGPHLALPNRVLAGGQYIRTAPPRPNPQGLQNLPNLRSHQQCVAAASKDLSGVGSAAGAILLCDMGLRTMRGSPMLRWGPPTRIA